VEGVLSSVAEGRIVEVLLDAVLASLQADATLMALVTGVYEEVPEAARTSYPYVVLSDLPGSADRFGGMGQFGGRVRFAVDVFSSYKGDHETHTILARVAKLLWHTDLSLPAGYALGGGSLDLPEPYFVSREPDPDMPDRELRHGHMEWEADVEETA
jgi:hypothetical protein